MQQRRLRLGDILDDYCPRERRVTNHAVVAMIDDSVKQTRCTACDAEHEYKEGRAPAPRRKKTGALFQEVLENARPRVFTPPSAHPEQDTANLDEAELDEADLDDTLDTESGTGFADAPQALAFASGGEAAGDDPLDGDDMAAAPEDEGVREDEGPVHRRLIRATLPRPEGQAPEWKEPEFTMRQPSGREVNGNREGNHRRRGRGGQGGARGMYGQGGPRDGGLRGPMQSRGPQGQRFDNARPGGSRNGQHAANGQGPRNGNRHGQPGQRQGGGPGRKRGR